MSQYVRYKRRWGKYSLLVMFFACPWVVRACDLPVSFNIRAQSVDQALLEFARQAELSILFPRTAYARVEANALNGEYCIEEGLDILLRGIDVSAELHASGQLVVSAAAPSSGTAVNGMQDTDSSEAGKPLLSVIADFFTGKGEQVQTRRAIPPLEEIIVTGSRVRQATGMTAPTPMTAVSNTEIANFQPSSTISEQLDVLPQLFSTQTAQRGGITFIDAGGSYLNLRGMGPNRTLVLLNGFRVIPSDSFGNVNVDNFPTALLERVEIVTGGASAAYGADAISGVINFIVNENFEGLKGSISAGVTERGDGDNWKISMAGGRQLTDRLHVTASVDARYIDQIDPDPDRLDNWQDWDHVLNPAWDPDNPASGEPRRLTRPHVFPTYHAPQGLITTPDFVYSGYTFTDDASDIRPYEFGDHASFFGVDRGALGTQAGGPEYETWRNSQSGGPDSNEVVSRSMFLNGNYALNDSLTLNGKALIARTESNAYGRRGNPALDGVWSAIIFQDNAFLPEKLRDAMSDAGLESITVSKRGTVYGKDKVNFYDDRGDRNINQVELFSAGFTREFANDWSLTGIYQSGESVLASSALNILRLDNFFMALDAVPDPATGSPVCNVSLYNPTPEELKASVEGKLFPSPLSLTGVAVDSPIGPMNFSECVPINVFGLGNVSPAAREWVVDDEKKNLRTLNQTYIELILSGTLHEGWGAGPLGFATGLTRRAEDFTQFSFPLFGERGLSNAPELGIRGIPGGFTGPGNRTLHQFSTIGAGSGDLEVNEWFGEVNIPLFNLRTGQSMGSSLALRNSGYSGHDPVWSWKAGIDFQLSNDLRWRFTRSQDVREPNFIERFVAGGGGAIINDPQFNETYWIVSVSGPNPDLEAEEASTIATGLVYQPSFNEWIAGLQIAIDWYEIELASAVSRLGPQLLIDDCFESADPVRCNLVQRNPDTNRVDRVIDRYYNVGEARTSGVDLEIQYFYEPDIFPGRYEALTFRGFFGYLRENSTTTATGRKSDLVGQTNRPEYTANLTFSYRLGPAELRLQQRYIDSTLVNVEWVEGVDVDDNTNSSQSVTNLGLSYNHGTGPETSWRLSFDVTNLFDREPPVVPGQFLSNSHDQYGRRFQVGLAVDF